MHTKSHVREAFEEVADSGLLWGEDLTLDTPLDTDEPAFDGQPFGGLLRQLWNSTDCMPASLREEVRDAFDMDTEPFSYAQAAQRIRKQLST
jgi:hypothetical protein